MQAPNVEKARMYKVLKEVAENKMKGARNTETVAWRASLNTNPTHPWHVLRGPLCVGAPGFGRKI